MLSGEQKRERGRVPITHSTRGDCFGSLAHSPALKKNSTVRDIEHGRSRLGPNQHNEGMGSKQDARCLEAKGCMIIREEGPRQCRLRHFVATSPSFPL
ncbi:hypothetical protein ElyMa_002496500 [Elysia marginata]|uniref:Uncharacterized protein n=1 Tax=Elysia marginata TaxID=1093978 RepID=A0AAV4GQI6_9GAST|nr:hypothetical protein ElyMa_002496500 [Elysia marginata]